jgi:small neutral amino acid transporter SnatA (MarC family)
VSLPRHHYECRSMDAMWLLVVAFVLATILVVIATSVGIACFRVLSNSEMTAVNRIA